MATTKWLGSSDSSWNTAGNWDNGIPANGDSVIISRLATRSLLTNLDRTGDTAGAGLALALFHIENGFNFAVGSSGERLKLTGTKIKVENGGEFWFNSDMGSGTTDTGILIVNNPLAEVDALATESIDYVHLLSGSLTLSNRTISDGGVVYVVPTVGQATLNFSWPSWIGGTQQIHMRGGQVEFANDDEAAVVDVWMSGGTFIFTRGTVSDLWMDGGNFYHDALSPSIISNADVLGGVYDSTRTAGTKLVSLFTYSDELAELIRNDDWVSPTTEVKLGG